MIDYKKQSRLDRYLNSEISKPVFGKSGKPLQDVDYYEIWDWWVKTKTTIKEVSKKFNVDDNSIYRWIKRTEHNLDDVKRERVIDGVKHWFCMECNEMKPMNDEYYHKQNNSRGFRACCKKCQNQKTKHSRENEKGTT